jgi:hypothetical protein
VNCPFCAEEIKDDAVVCKHCRRDLAIVRPVLLELRAHAEQIAALKDELQAVRFLLETTSEPRPVSIVVAGVPGASGVTSDIAGVAIGLISALLILLVAHYVIIWELDLDRRWLLGATVLVPYLAALCTRALTRVAIPVLVALALVLGIVSVGAMSLVTAWGNIAMALPNGRSEWISDGGWVLSVALSFITGALTPRAIVAGAKLLFGDGVAKAETHIVRVVHLIEVATPIVTAMGAVETGVRSLLR